MPPPTNPVSKRRRPAFKPPRPTTKTSKTKNPPPRRKSAPGKHSFQDSAADDDDEDNEEDTDTETDTNPLSSPSPSPSPPQDAPPTIPPALLTRLLHHHFHNDTVTMASAARGVVGKYMETFVREAIARAAFERSEGVGGDFVEVEDLEKLAPQLLLDF